MKETLNLKKKCFLVIHERWSSENKVLGKQFNKFVGDGEIETTNNKYQYFCVWFHNNLNRSGSWVLKQT